MRFSCGVPAKRLVSKGKVVQTLRGRKQTLPLTFHVSAIRNGNDEHESIIDHLEDAQTLRNHRNLLDKLKAVHMHVLATEQWNAEFPTKTLSQVYLFILLLIQVT